MGREKDKRLGGGGGEVEAGKEKREGKPSLLLPYHPKASWKYVGVCAG